MSLEKQVYHVCGSPTSRFFYDLSLIYARETFVPAGWNEKFIVVEPNGKWRTGDSLSRLSKNREPQAVIAEMSKDSIVVPHLFCYKGMTEYRNFFENILGYKLIGSSGDVMATAADKNLCRKKVQKQGVHVAPGGLIAEIDAYKLKLPIIIKPNQEDNSVGLSMVSNKRNINDAIRTAGSYGEMILAEQYISGREVRIAVLETANGYLVPPVIEYLVTAENPIRQTSDKLKIGLNGNPKYQAQDTPVGMICPANLDSALHKKVSDYAISAHQALGARDYSLFDFRIEEGTDIPFFLEAGLFWSFSEAGMISKMLQAGGYEIEELIRKIWERDFSQE